MAAVNAEAEVLELEAMRRDDGSWHPCGVSLSLKNNFSIMLNFKGCGTEDIVSSREDVVQRLRFCSIPLQDDDCSHLKVGEKVLATNNVQSENLCFDAVVEKVYKVRHSGRLQCRCTFKVKWLTPRMKGITLTVPSKSIMKLSDKTIDKHPVIATFLAYSRPQNDVLVPPSLGSLEETTSKANPEGVLEKQVSELSKLAGKTECSKDVLLGKANAFGQRREFVTSDTIPPRSEDDSRRITRSRTNEQDNAELVEHIANSPILSPLAARAALASVMHRQLLDKQEYCIFWSQEHLLDLPMKDEKKYDVEQHLEVKAGVIHSDAHATSVDVAEQPNFVQESTNDKLLEDHDLKTTVSTSIRGAKRSLFSDSPCLVTSLKKPARASKEESNGNLVFSISANNSTELATKEKLDHGGVSARLTQSAAKNQILGSPMLILGSTDKVPSGYSSQVNTRLTRAGQRKATNITHIDQALEDTNKMKDAGNFSPPKKDKSNKREFASTSIKTSPDRAPEKKKEAQKSSIDVTEEDQGVMSQDGEIQAKKKKVSSKKPVLRFSPRLRSLSKTG